MNESQLREEIVARASSLHARGYAHGSSGNLSAVVDDCIMVTPTGSSLGRLDPARLSKVTREGSHLSGDPPSKETFLHLALYARRPKARAIVHLHCTCAVAVSCLVHADVRDVLAPLTAYHVMRVGPVPLIPYYAPGDRALADAVGESAVAHRAMLLANHGPVVSGRSLDEANDAAEELEQTARLSLMLTGRDVQPLTAAQSADLARRFPD